MNSNTFWSINYCKCVFFFQGGPAGAMCHAHVRILPGCWRDSVWLLSNHSRSSQGAEHQKAATHTSVGEWQTSQHMASCFSVANFGKQISHIVFRHKDLFDQFHGRAIFFPLPQINFHLHVVFGRSLSMNESHFPFFSVFLLFQECRRWWWLSRVRGTRITPAEVSRGRWRFFSRQLTWERWRSSFYAAVVGKLLWEWVQS